MRDRQHRSEDPDADDLHPEATDSMIDAGLVLADPVTAPRPAAQLDGLRQRLLRDACVFDDPAAYAAGVEDALAAVLAAAAGVPGGGTGLLRAGTATAG